jgi:hypothetical protein
LQIVMAYAELALRKSPVGSPPRQAVEVISAEAQRMADIVRKIGKITKYETKDYLGEQRILDLDASSADTTPPPPPPSVSQSSGPGRISSLPAPRSSSAPKPGSAKGLTDDKGGAS